MELDSESKNKLSKQPFIIRQAADYVLNLLNTLINGGCDESTIVSTMGTLNQNSQGKFSDSDLLNYDEACTILGLQVTNRVGLKKLLDRHGIKQVKIKNKPSGFRRDQILALRDKIDLDEDKRKQREERKMKREQEKYHKRQAFYEKIMGRKSDD